MSDTYTKKVEILCAPILELLGIPEFDASIDPDDPTIMNMTVKVPALRVVTKTIKLNFSFGED